MADFENIQLLILTSILDTNLIQGAVVCGLTHQGHFLAAQISKNTEIL
jgi:hypothetical protein